MGFLPFLNLQMSLCCGTVLGGRLLSPPDNPKSVLPADQLTLLRKTEASVETGQGEGMYDRTLVYMSATKENKPILEN